MTTVIEIERAIERLPAKELLEVGEWLDEQRSTLAASADIFFLYDAEEGEGQQWLE